MKKLLTLMLAAMFVFAIVACGDSKKEETNNDSDSTDISDEDTTPATDGEPVTDEEPATDGDTEPVTDEEPVTDGDTEPVTDEEPATDGDTEPAADEEPATDGDTEPATDEEPATDGDTEPAGDEEPATDEDVEPEAPIVVNGGFEEVDENGIPSNWHTANSTGDYPVSSILTANISSVTDAAYVKSGSKAVKLTSTKSGNERFVADGIALAAGNYKCSVFAKGNTNVKIGYYDGSSYKYNSTNHTALTDEWQEIVYEFALATDAPTISFVILVSSRETADKDGYFDDFVCEKVSE